jgi:hypothetical protein
MDVCHPGYITKSKKIKNKKTTDSHAGFFFFLFFYFFYKFYDVTDMAIIQKII